MNRTGHVMWPRLYIVHVHSCRVFLTIYESRKLSNDKIKLENCTLSNLVLFCSQAQPI